MEGNSWTWWDAALDQSEERNGTQVSAPTCPTLTLSPEDHCDGGLDLLQE